MKCLKQIKEESSKDKLIAVIDIFLAQKYQCRRNKVLSKIFMAYLEELIVMGHKEIADSYTDKIPFLTHQEKKNIKKLL